MSHTLYLIFIQTKMGLYLANYGEGFLSYADANNHVEGIQKKWKDEPAKFHIIGCPIMKTIEVKSNGTR